MAQPAQEGAGAGGSTSNFLMGGDEHVCVDDGQGHQQEEEDDDHDENSSCSCLVPASSLRSTDEASRQADGGVRSLSFSKILSYSFRMASHDAAGAAKQEEAEAEAENNNKLTTQQQVVCRSQSMPATRRCSSSSSGKGSGSRSRRVADSSAREEEDMVAVCRICLVALSSESEPEVLKLECCCKGELALAHTACALKWFSIKGNATCDVCSQQVRNLPAVTLQGAAAARPSSGLEIHADSGGGDPPTTTTTIVRVWHGTPILVIVSMLAYFCFLEQLLLGDHGTAALAISLPFACVLGLFSSLTITKMVSKRYVWIYSAVQFLFIVLFTHIFYRYLQMQAVIAIILSTFAGFTVAITTNSLLLQIIRWRAAAASPTTTADGAQGQGPSTSREPPPVPDLEIALPPAPAPAPTPAPA